MPYNPGEQTGTDAVNKTIAVKISSPVIDFEAIIPAGTTVKMADKWPEWIDTTGYAAIAFEFTVTQPISYGIDFRSDQNKPTIRPVITNTVNDVLVPRPGAINTRRKWVQFSVTNNGTQDATVCFVAQLSTSPIQSSFEPLNAMVANTRLVPIQKIGGVQLKDSNGDFNEVLRDDKGLAVVEQRPLDLSKLAKTADFQLIVDALAKKLNVNTVDVSALAKDTSITALNTILQLLGKDTNLVAILNAIGVTNNKDFATQATLAQVFTVIQAVRDKLSADPATATNQSGQSTLLSNILTKLSADPAKDASVQSLITAVQLLGKDTTLQSIVTALGVTNAKDFATQTTLVAVLAKLTSDPSTGANQTTQNTTLASILAKISADPATQTTLLNLYNLFFNGTAKAAVSLLSTDPGVQAIVAAFVTVVNAVKATQYAEDTAAVSGESLTMAGAIRKDTPGSLVDADLDRTELQTDEIGGLRVNVNRSRTATQSTVNATTTGAQALTANPLRRNVIITNTTSTVVSIHYGTATTARITTINSINGYWEMAPDLFTGVITVKSSSGTPLLEVVETV